MPRPSDAAPALRLAREITVGIRPNVVSVVGDSVFVGSFRRDRVTVLSAESGRRRAVSPRIGTGVTDAAVGFGSIWYTVSRSRQLARVDARTGRLRGAPIPLPGGPGSVAVSRDALWVGIVNANAPDLLLKLDPRTGETLASVRYPYGVMAITASPSAVWVVSRRRSRLQRVDPDTAQPVKSIQFARSRGADIVYRAGALLIPTPGDDTVYKAMTKTEEIIPISVGSRPRRVALGGDRVFVSNYNSSDLYAIDTERSRVAGPPVTLPVNQFGLAVGGGAVWIVSQPDNKLSQVLTDRGA